jgi:hypothetical protein
MGIMALLRLREAVWLYLRFTLSYPGRCSGRSSTTATAATNDRASIPMRSTAWSGNFPASSPPHRRRSAELASSIQKMDHPLPIAAGTTTVGSPPRLY